MRRLVRIGVFSHYMLSFVWKLGAPIEFAVWLPGAVVMALSVWLIAEWQYRRARSIPLPAIKRTHVLVGGLVLVILLAIAPASLERLQNFLSARQKAAFAPYDRFWDETFVFRIQVRRARPDHSLVPRAYKLLSDAEEFRDDWNYGDAIHYANLFLGRVALENGDIRQARSRLLEAGRTPGSQWLDYNGPDMTLADELLDRGESKVVLQYFRECKRFWPNNQLKEWAAAVRAGKRPDFRKRSAHSVIVTESVSTSRAPRARPASPATFASPLRFRPARFPAARSRGRSAARSRLAHRRART